MIDYQTSESIQGAATLGETTLGETTLGEATLGEIRHQSSPGLLIGRIIGLQDNGNPLVAFDSETQVKPTEALTVVPLDGNSVGKDVAISFAQNQGSMPIVMGVILRLLDCVLNDVEPKHENSELKPEVIVDGNKLELSAPEEVTIRCGEASITLNKSGKILIKGEHMLNRISGAYKIKSGSIELN